MPPAIARRVEAALGAPATDIAGLSGGDIADVWRADVRGLGAVVIKVGTGVDVEASMLRYLAQESALPVPQVHLVDSDMLVMEWIAGAPGLPPGAQENAAEHLARLHDVTGDQFGLDFETRIGGLPQANRPADDWGEFFADRRLRAMTRIGLEAGRLPAAMAARVEGFADALPRWIDSAARPGLVHGDAWSGNILCDHSRVTAFIDPAIYYADPEIELAFGTLFGTFGERFFRRYDEIRPIRDGFFETRREIYNLYPLLVHVRLFGESYVASVDRTLRRFGF